jgi:hypothetical protein
MSLALATALITSRPILPVAPLTTTGIGEVFVIKNYQYFGVKTLFLLRINFSFDIVPKLFYNPRYSTEITDYFGSRGDKLRLLSTVSAKESSNASLCSR